MTDNGAYLQEWVGRSATVCDTIAPAPVAGLAAALDHPRPPQPGDSLPAGWHWLFFQQPVRASRLGPDGHPLRGDFLPPVSLPRRMWAGGRLTLYAPLRVGDALRRQSTVAAVQRKRGRSGELVFVRVLHRIHRGQVLLLEEEQDIVYREAAGAAGAPVGEMPPGEAQWSRLWQPDPVALFRYSALTFNAHRIHYDRDYATGREGYGGLVVQGPLTATLLLDLLRAQIGQEQPASFAFRGLRPLLDTGAVALQGRRDGNAVTLWALDADGALAMRASAQLAAAGAAND
ncbi:MAG: acyl-CoA dehydrogenase [Halioglobus sp.]|nr:acyl-CoA dehydrogenase [Halioglobus sp.]